MSNVDLMVDASAAIARSLEAARWLATELHDLTLSASLRNRVAGACFSVTQEHHCAIVLLLEHELNASAFALLRLQYESYVRGLWCAHCATDAELDRFAKGAEPPRIAELLATIEKHEAYAAGTLSSWKQQGWSAMCSYTHTGGLQVQRFQTETSIESNFPPEELVEVANAGATFALLSGIGTAALASNEVLGLAVLQRSKDFTSQNKA
jgi:hypothetical protein